MLRASTDLSNEWHRLFGVGLLEVYAQAGIDPGFFFIDVNKGLTWTGSF